MDVVFHGLFAFKYGSVCELRIFEDAGRRLVVATELDDNPGTSAINAVEALARDVARDFGPMATTLIVHAPAGEGETCSPIWSEAAISDAGVAWNRTSREQIQEIVGVALPEPVMEECTMIFAGGEGHPLLGLIQADDDYLPLGARLTVVPVALLPWPHNPSRCSHHTRFDQLSEFYPPACWTKGVAGAHFFLTLTGQDFSACSYHEPDWSRVAEASVEVLEALPYEAELEEALAAASGRIEKSLEADALRSVFADPIVWSPGSDMATNGQHRACALKASGASLCVIDTNGEPVSVDVIGDPKARARADLASFWATQTFQPDNYR
jgi:hypothetical protein